MKAFCDDEAAIRAFLRRACDVTARLLAEKSFAQTPPILTGCRLRVV